MRDRDRDIKYIKRERERERERARKRERLRDGKRHLEKRLATYYHIYLRDSVLTRR